MFYFSFYLFSFPVKVKKIAYLFSFSFLKKEINQRRLEKGEKNMKLLSKNEALQEIMKRKNNEDPAYNEWLVKNNYYLLTNSNDLIEIDKPRIKKVMYYDDEGPRPSTAYESWKEYNISYYFSIPRYIEEWKKDIAELKKTGCCRADLLKHPAYIKYENQYKYTVYLYLDWYEQERKAGSLVYLDEKETEEYIKCIDVIMNEYEKRLKTYYKKYSDKIYTYGYWANR